MGLKSGDPFFWVNQHKLEMIKKLEIGPNIYLIKTGPGLIALETANSIYKSGEVVAPR